MKDLTLGFFDDETSCELCIKDLDFHCTENNLRISYEAGRVVLLCKVPDDAVEHTFVMGVGIITPFGQAKLAVEFWLKGYNALKALNEKKELEIKVAAEAAAKAKEAKAMDNLLAKMKVAISDMKGWQYITEENMEFPKPFQKLAFEKQAELFYNLQDKQVISMLFVDWNNKTFEFKVN